MLLITDCDIYIKDYPKEAPEVKGERLSLFEELIIDTVQRPRWYLPYKQLSK